MNDAPLAFLASNMDTQLFMNIGIIDRVISIAVAKAYAYLPNICERADPKDLESSSGIVVSAISIDARTIERNDAE